MNRIFITLLSFLPLTAFAQLMYTDISPDYYQNYSTDKTFDLNKDGKSDIVFSLMILDAATDVWFNISTSDSFEVCIDSANLNFITRFDAGAPITAGMKWKQGNNIPMAYLTSGFPEGPWPGSADKYFAFRFMKGSGYQYGWMRMSVHNKVNSFTLKEYAYQAGPDVPMSTGQIVNTAVRNEALPANELTWTLHDHALSVYSTREFQEATLYSMTGAQQLHISFAGTSGTMNVSGISAGVYTLVCRGLQGTSVKKVMIE